MSHVMMTSSSRTLRQVLAGALFSAVVLVGAQPAQAQNWQTCLEAIVQVQKEMKQVLPRPAQPQELGQSIAAQDSTQPTPGSLEAAGLDQPTGGAWGALNEAMNLQAAGNETGCMQAVNKARSLAGLD